MRNNINKILVEIFIKENYKCENITISDELNKDGKYEVSSNSNVVVKNKNTSQLTNGMFVWYEVNGDFNCEDCDSLTSLEGAPEKIRMSFYCNNCEALKTLKGAPKEVGRNFWCCGCNSLTSLEGAPEKIMGNFSCNNCALLYSLEGAPKEVGGYFSCSNCKNVFVVNDIKKISNINGKIRV